MPLKNTLALATALFIAAPTVTTPTFAASILSGTQLKNLLTGKTVRFQRGSRATYNADGSYRFRGQGRNDRGKWRVSGNKVCVTFSNVNFRRCDKYIKDGANYIVRDANGNEYPVRSIK